MSEEYEFIRELECIGKWWLPEKDEEQLCGALKFNSTSGGKLELVLQPDNHIDINPVQDSVTLFGHTNIGDITLFDCKLGKRDASVGTLSTAIFEFNEGIIGTHISNKEDILMRMLAVNFLYLNAWCDSYGVKPEEVFFSFVKKKEEFSFKLPQPFLLAKSNDYEVYLIADNKRSFSLTDTSKQIIFEETPYVEILLQDKNTLKDYQEFVNSIQCFLTLAVREQVFPLFVTGVTTDGQRIKYFHRLSATHDFSTFLVANFALSDIQENIKEYFQNWLDNRDKLNSACELYFSSLNENLNPELRFLYLIQAVEALHRTVFEENKYISDEEYRKDGGLYDKFIKTVEQKDTTPDFKDSLKHKLKYENEYSLRKRLKGMLNKNLELINARKVIINGAIDTFIEKVMDTRDYYTHHDEDLKDRILKGKELEHAVKVLTALVEIILIFKAGFSNEKIKELRRTTHPL
jgi:hypothetical protein